MAQEILLFGAETWVILAEMDCKVEVKRTRFLQQITRKQSRRLAEGTREIPGVEVVWEAAGMQLENTYIGRQPATEPVVSYVRLVY